MDKKTRDSYAKALADYCDKNSRFDLNKPVSQAYKSLPICLIDCVYSLRSQYNSVTVPIVKRYAQTFLNGDPFSADDTISRFLENVQKCGGVKAFGKDILKSKNKLGGKVAIPKENIVCKIAEYLKALKIETIQDFKFFECQELLSVVLYGVKGMNNAGVNYLFMLAGDSNRCKPDVHIHHAIKDACGQDVSDDECQELFVGAVEILKKKYPSLSVRQLDGIIWGAYRK